MWRNRKPEASQINIQKINNTIQSIWHKKNQNNVTNLSKKKTVHKGQT